MSRLNRARASGVPAEFLVNHRTILWDDHAAEVTLYQVDPTVPGRELSDDGNRWLFQNANAKRSSIRIALAIITSMR
jgi:hypothetical protein